MPSATTTRQKVLNYIRRCDDVDVLRDIEKATRERSAAVRDAMHDAGCRAAFDAVRKAAVIVRSPINSRVFFGKTPKVFTGDRWHVREEYRGRKYRGVFVSREADSPKSRNGWHFLSWEDCDCWIPEEVAEVVS